MTNNLKTLATALCVKIDDWLKAFPELVPWRSRVGIAPKLGDAELVTLAVMSVLLGFTSERRWLRHARSELSGMFPYLPQQPGYNKRLRAAAGLVVHMIQVLGRDTSLWSDDVWVVDSTPVECGRSRETARRPQLAGWAEYGYCASHSRFFWGLRLHLLCTLGGLPVAFALTGAKADERTTLLDMLDADPDLAARHPGQSIIGDRHYYGRAFETGTGVGEMGDQMCGVDRLAVRSERGITPRHAARRRRASGRGADTGMWGSLGEVSEESPSVGAWKIIPRRGPRARGRRGISGRRRRCGSPTSWSGSGRATPGRGRPGGR